MEYLYFATDWVVNTNFSFQYLINTADQLNCHLVISKDIKKTSEGLFFYTFSVRVASQTVLQKFIEKIGNDMQIIKWHPISEQDYKEGSDLKGFIYSMDATSFTSWLDAVIGYGKHNESLKDRLTHDTKEVIYCECEWLLRPNQLTRFEDAWLSISKLNGAIYLLLMSKDKRDCHILKLGIRAPSGSVLQTFMDEIGNSLDLTNCHPINADEFYWGTKITTTGVYGVKEIQERYMPYALENETILKKYS